jgi:tRNA(adenine34) deaminase
MNLLQDERFNHQSEVERGVLEEECRTLLQDFFRALRKERKENSRKHLREHMQEENKG